MKPVYYKIQLSVFTVNFYIYTDLLFTDGEKHFENYLNSTSETIHAWIALLPITLTLVLMLVFI